MIYLVGVTALSNAKLNVIVVPTWLIFDMDPTSTSSIRRLCLGVDNGTLFPSLIYNISFALSPDGGSNDGWCGV